MSKVEPVQGANPRLNEVTSVLEELGYNPVEALVLAAQKAKELSEDESCNMANRISFLSLEMKAGAELLAYKAPKLKSVEVSGPGGKAVPLAQTIEIVPVSASADK